MATDYPKGHAMLTNPNRDRVIVTLTLATGTVVETAPMMPVAADAMIAGMLADTVFAVTNVNVRLATPDAVIDSAPESRGLYDADDEYAKVASNRESLMLMGFDPNDGWE